MQNITLQHPARPAGDSQFDPLVLTPTKLVERAIHTALAEGLDEPAIFQRLLKLNYTFTLAMYERCVASYTPKTVRASRTGHTNKIEFSRLAAEFI